MQSRRPSAKVKTGREKTSQAVKKRQKAPQRAEESAQEGTVAGIQFGIYAVEPAACAVKAVEEAPGLEKWLRPKTSALK